MRAPLVQVCPAGTGGVRDYAQALAAVWRGGGLENAVVCAEAPGPGRTSLQAQLEAQAAGPRLDIVLHFSGYGYQARGLCLWLVDALGALRRERGEGLRVAIVFHELFARTRPWRSGFWLAPLQRLIAGRLARAADVLWTNTEQHARWLAKATGGRIPIVTRPVFSNVGEGARAADWPARAARAVVFGSPSTRARAFAALRGREGALAALGIEEVVEVGSGAAQSPARVARHLGRLGADELGALLGASRFGLLDYPADCLGKSSVFAAYAAHGCAALNTDPTDQFADGLRAGTHYLPLARAGARPDAAALGRAARAWYLEHALGRQATELLELLTGAPRRVTPFPDSAVDRLASPR